MKFVSARKEGRSVIYTADDGSAIKYSGGDPAWRTNNPGNLWSDKVSSGTMKFGSSAILQFFPTMTQVTLRYWIHSGLLIGIRALKR